jgi:hypothetical protein
LTIFVTYMKNQGFFDPTSPTARHYAPALKFLLIHGFFGALALLLGVFQLSNRLRARYLRVHRGLGYMYIVSVFVAAPFAVSSNEDRLTLPRGRLGGAISRLDGHDRDCTLLRA